MTAEELAYTAAKLGDMRKAEDIRVYAIADHSVVADYFVVMTGFNRRQIQSVAWELDKELKARDVAKLGFEGYDSAWWVLVDYGSVVVHVFHEDAREYYGFDDLWNHAPTREWQRLLDEPDDDDDDDDGGSDGEDVAGDGRPDTLTATGDDDGS
jgi:ribosome-associated protein